MLHSFDFSVFFFRLDWGAGFRGSSGGGPGDDEAGGAAEGGEGTAQLHPLGESARGRVIGLQTLLRIVGAVDVMLLIDNHVLFFHKWSK